MAACHGHVHQLASAVRTCGRPAVDAVGMVYGEVDLERGTIFGGRGQGIFVFEATVAGQSPGCVGKWRWGVGVGGSVTRRPPVLSGTRDPLASIGARGDWATSWERRAFQGSPCLSAASAKPTATSNRAAAASSQRGHRGGGSGVGWTLPLATADRSEPAVYGLNAAAT